MKNINEIKSALAAAAHAVTARARGGESTGTLSAEQTAEVEAFKQLLDRHDFGCQTEGVAHVAAFVSGKPHLLQAVPAAETGSTLQPLTVVRITGNESGHRYEGALYLALTDGRLLTRNGLRGRAIDPEDYAIATEPEVDSAVDTLTSRQIEAIRNNRLFWPILNPESRTPANA